MPHANRVTERAEARPATCPPDAVNAGAWFALRVRSNFERRVRDSLRTKGIEEFLPTWTEEVRWSDRSKLIERPLIPGYNFARFERGQAAEVTRIAGIVRLPGRARTGRSYIPVSTAAR